MKMRNRDKAIIQVLEKFYVLKRDQIAKMFFSHCKRPVTNANFVLKRLRDRGYIDADTNKAFEQYIYFSKPSKIKKKSQKINHYLMIADIYLQMMKYHKITHFEIEPYIKEVKLIPDIFAIWGNSLWWIEAQNSIYSSKQMYEKLDKYQELLQSGGYKELSFQPEDKKIFPNVLIIGERKFNVEQYTFRIFQAKNVDEFMENMRKRS
jgi:hypothetical protein